MLRDRAVQETFYPPLYPRPSWLCALILWKKIQEKCWQHKSEKRVILSLWWNGYPTPRIVISSSIVDPCQKRTASYISASVMHETTFSTFLPAKGRRVRAEDCLAAARLPAMVWVHGRGGPVSRVLFPNHHHCWGAAISRNLLIAITANIGVKPE